MKVEVTQADIDCGWAVMESHGPDLDRRGCGICPVEHAATRAFGEEMRTSGVMLWRKADQGREPTPIVYLPEQAREAIREIDRGAGVPFSFEVEL